MIEKKMTLHDSRLYIIVSPEDAERLSMSLEDMVQEAALGGADIVQLRDKTSSDQDVVGSAQTLRTITRKSGCLFIINDRPLVAKACEADGVHLGQDDAPISEAKRILGPEKIVGRSTHSLEQARQAEEAGADYIGYGPIFRTPTKPDYEPVGLSSMRVIAKEIRIPFFAIGGIDASNIKDITAEGASRIAVVRAAVANRNIREAVRGLKMELEQSATHAS